MNDNTEINVSFEKGRNVNWFLFWNASTFSFNFVCFIIRDYIFTIDFSCEIMEEETCKQRQARENIPWPVPSTRKCHFKVKVKPGLITGKYLACYRRVANERVFLEVPAAPGPDEGESYKGSSTLVTLWIVNKHGKLNC